MVATGKLIVWLRNLARWLGEAKWVMATAAAFLLAAGWGSYGFGAPAVRLRAIGLGLQLFGLCTVAHELIAVRNLFRLPSMSSLLSDWWSRLPSWPRDQVVVGEGIMSSGSATMTGHGEAYWGADPDAPIQEQINRLAKNQEDLRRRLGEVEAETPRRIRKLTHQVKELESRSTREVREVRSLLEESQTTGFYVAFFGLLSIAAGLVFATLPGEIVAAWNAIPW